VRDYYCKESPLSHWSAFFSMHDVLAALEGRHLIGGALKRFEIGRKSSLGLVKDFVATIGDESIRIKANDLRLALGATAMKSARILRIRKVRGGVEFEGSGSGHGVGLCQWGSRIQADKGRAYEQILKFYFPGSTLSIIDE
jgi:stage II sporulation protein D